MSFGDPSLQFLGGGGWVCGKEDAFKVLNRVESIEIKKPRETYAVANLRICQQKPLDLMSILAELIMAKGETRTSTLSQRRCYTGQ